MKKKLKEYWIPFNLGLAVCLVLALVIGTNALLRCVTQHGKELIVPDFTNMTYEEAKQEAANAGVRVVVSDSVYVRQMRKGAVYNQTPKAGASVKHGRRILLTTNTRQPKKIAMPSLIGLSMYMAKAELATKGLNLGRLIYQEDIATNNVLKQQYRGGDIKPGTMIQSGSVINLVVGLSSSDSQTYIPNLVGNAYPRAVDLVQENSLNVGKLIFDKEVSTYADSVSAVVYAQSPKYSSQAVRMGQEVSLYLTNDKSRIEGKH